MKLWTAFAVAAVCVSTARAEENTGPSKVTIDKDKVLECNGKKLFPIGFTMPPPPDGKTPDGKHAYDELRSAGAWFFRTGPSGGADWDDAWFATEQKYMDSAAKHGLHCAPWLKEASAVKDGD